MRRRIVIIGGGTGGTIAANRLRRHYGNSAEIVVLDRDDQHVYQPGLLFVAFGMEEPERIVRSRRKQLRQGIHFQLAEVERVQTGENLVHLTEAFTKPMAASHLAGMLEQKGIALEAARRYSDG